jgi:hypothetical protein
MATTTVNSQPMGELLNLIGGGASYISEHEQSMSKLINNDKSGIRASSMSEIVYNDGENSVVLNNSRTVELRNTKENDAQIINSYEAASCKTEEELLQKEAALRLRLKELQNTLHSVQLDRERIVLENEIEIDQAKERLNDLTNTGSRLEDRLEKAKEHLHLAKRKQLDIESKREFLQNEVAHLSNLNQALVLQTHELDTWTQSVGHNVEEYSKKLGKSHAFGEETIKRETSREQVQSEDQTPGIEGFDQRKGLLKRLKDRTLRVLPKKKLFFPKTNALNENKIGSVAYLLKEAKNENDRLRQQLQHLAELDLVDAEMAYENEQDGLNNHGNEQDGLNENSLFESNDGYSV